jgi:hypothetical protein
MTAATKVIPLALPAQAISSNTNRSTMTFLSPDEVLAVLKAARQRSVRDWAMILMALGTAYEPAKFVISSSKMRT